MTFSETYAIYYKAHLNNVHILDVNTVLNLKHAWQYVLSNITMPLDLTFILNAHKEVSKDEALEWGILRSGHVGISGTNYKPPIPNREFVIKSLEDFEKINGNTERAIEYMLWMMKQQLFWDGDKRIAM